MQTSNTKRRTLDAGLNFIVVCFTLIGCCPLKPPTTPPISYFGPTESMQSVVAAINENNLKIPTLWTQLNYTATLVDSEKKTTDTISGDGGLMYARPMSLLVHGNKDIAGQVFQVGSNDTEFWVKTRSSADSFIYRWGHYANIGKPGCQPIPIRPDLVLQVLGIGLYGTDFLQQPVPVMRFDNEHDAYVFDLNLRSIDRWEISEEVWYDRKHKLPTRVLLYGPQGRILLKAELSDHVPVQSTGLPKDQWPSIARHYDMLFSDGQTRITLDFIDQPQLQHARPRGGPIPNPGSFERVPPDANNRVIQIDKDCADAAVMAR